MPTTIGQQQRRLSRGFSSRNSSSFNEEGNTNSATSSNHNRGKSLPPTLVYHSSARSIVFRDHLRRVKRSDSSPFSAAPFSAPSSSHPPGEAEGDESSKAAAAAVLPELPPMRGHTVHLPVVTDDAEHRHVDQVGTVAKIATEILDDQDTTVEPSQAGIPPTQIAGFLPSIEPLPSLEFLPDDEWPVLLQDDTITDKKNWTEAEQEVVQRMRDEQAVVKTVKNSEWSDFLQRFLTPQPQRRRALQHQDRIIQMEDNGNSDWNSFMTSTTLLPSEGLRMRCYGSTSQYTTGVIFALPTPAGVFAGNDDDDDELADEAQDEEAKRTMTWSWPAGYSAKTEFNIDGRGRLINGREEALCPLSVLRQYNDDYLYQDEYVISSRKVSGLSQIPYNEVYLRVGGMGRIVNGKDVVTGKECTRSFENGVGLPIALFVRTATFGHLISMLRTRARLVHVLGEEHIRGIPLLVVTPTRGIKVLTKSLQAELWKIAARNLCPFQNSSIAHRTTVSNTDEDFFQQKIDELLDFDDSISEMLTPQELAHLAGGFGATDESVATILTKVMLYDRKVNKQKAGQGDHKKSEESHKLQDVVNEGLAYAVRSGDYHTARQLLIVYSLVASRQDDLDDDFGEESGEQKTDKTNIFPHHQRSSSLGRDTELLQKDLDTVLKHKSEMAASIHAPPPPPPPLDTDRLRNATNSDGLLAVLGAAQVLKAMQDGTAKKRVEEAIAAVEEWVNYGEQSVAFRIASWYDQRAAQGDLKIALDDKSNFMAFVSNKAIANRKTFAQQLRDSVSATDDSSDVRFLMAINEILGSMHSPCLRLELLQYALGLDNRYSVAHVARSVELAATCLSMSTGGR